MRPQRSGRPGKGPGPAAWLNDLVEMLARAGYDDTGGPPRVEVRFRGAGGSGRVRLRVPAPGDGLPRADEDEATVPEPTSKAPNMAPPSWKWFSPLEERVILALQKAGGWMTSEQIAGAVGEPAGNGIKVLLGNLTERGVLQSSQGRGYKLVLGDE